MQQPSAVTNLRIPAEQDTPAAVHPTLRPFHAPPPSFATRLLLERLGFFAPCTERGGAAALLQEVPDLLIVIALSQPLGRVRGCAGRSTALRALVARTMVQSWRCAPSTASPHALAGGEDAACGAALAAGRGGLAPLGPPKGGLGHRSVHRAPLPSHALQGGLCHRALFPQRHEDVGLRPRLETPRGRTLRTEPCRIACTPLAASAQDHPEGIPGLPGSDTGPLAPQRVWGARGQRGQDALPSGSRHWPRLGAFLAGVRPP